MRAFRLEAKAVVRPAGDQPLHVRGDGFDIFEVLFDGVGVIKAEVALAIIFAGEPEVQANGLGVADMEIAIGLRREPGDDFGVALFGDVARNDVADKVAGRGNGGLFRHCAKEGESSRPRQ